MFFSASRWRNYSQLHVVVRCCTSEHLDTLTDILVEKRWITLSFGAFTSLLRSSLLFVKRSGRWLAFFFFLYFLCFSFLSFKHHNSEWAKFASVYVVPKPLLANIMWIYASLARQKEIHCAATTTTTGHSISAAAAALTTTTVAAAIVVRETSGAFWSTPLKNESFTNAVSWTQWSETHLARLICASCSFKQASFFLR